MFALVKFRERSWTMTINEFFAQNIGFIREIVDNLDSSFDSHRFIQKFAKRFEADYIDFLNNYRGEGAFQKVHEQIASALRRHEADLGIVGTSALSP
jgi:hypothetical protein